MKMYTDEVSMVVETKIKPAMKQIYEARIKGLGDKYIAKLLGITVQMFQKCLNECDELKDVYEDATGLLCSKLRDVVIGRALGTDGKKDANGKLMGPDAVLALRVLEKLDPAFSKTNEVKEIAVTIETVVHEINEKRRLEESKVIDMTTQERNEDED